MGGINRYTLLAVGFLLNCKDNQILVGKSSPKVSQILDYGIKANLN